MSSGLVLASLVLTAHLRIYKKLNRSKWTRIVHFSTIFYTITPIYRSILLQNLLDCIVGRAFVFVVNSFCRIVLSNICRATNAGVLQHATRNGPFFLVLPFLGRGVDPWCLWVLPL